MGLFDDLKKTIKNAIGEEETNKLKETFKNIKASDFRVEKNSTPKEIPADYTHFPPFDKSPEDLSVKNEYSYKRCTMDFYNVSESEIEHYREVAESFGYKRKTNVRYEKGKEYIIIEEDGDHLHLVFHINF